MAHLLETIKNPLRNIVNDMIPLMATHNKITSGPTDHIPDNSKVNVTSGPTDHIPDSSKVNIEEVEQKIQSQNVKIVPRQEHQPSPKHQAFLQWGNRFRQQQ